MKRSWNYAKYKRKFSQAGKELSFYKHCQEGKGLPQAHPEADIIRMGIGDVTQPIAKCVVEAMKKGADEMGVKGNIQGL